MKVGTLLAKLNKGSLHAQVKIAHGDGNTPTTVKEIYIRKDGTVVIR